MLCLGGQKGENISDTILQTTLEGIEKYNFNSLDQCKYIIDARKQNLSGQVQLFLGSLFYLSDFSIGN